MNFVNSSERVSGRSKLGCSLRRLADSPTQEFTFQQVAQDDPNLALAGLRIEIEKRLIGIAKRNNLDVRNCGIGQLLRLLSEHEVLDHRERSVLGDLTGLLNSAVHGASVDRQSASWAMDIGPRLLAALDELGPK